MMIVHDTKYEKAINAIDAFCKAFEAMEKACAEVGIDVDELCNSVDDVKENVKPE